MPISSKKFKTKFRPRTQLEKKFPQVVKDNIQLCLLKKIFENFFLKSFGWKYDDSLSDCFAALHWTSKNISAEYKMAIVNIFLNILVYFCLAKMIFVGGMQLIFCCFQIMPQRAHCIPEHTKEAFSSENVFKWSLNEKQCPNGIPVFLHMSIITSWSKEKFLRTC